MRIGIDGRELKKTVMTGTRRFLLNFLKYAPRLKPDWEFFLFTNQHAKFGFEVSNLKIRVIPEYLTLWWDQVKLPHYIKRERIDLFFSPCYKAPFSISCNLVITILDLLFLKIPFYHKPANFLYNCYIKNITNSIAGRADAVITCSEHSKRDLIEILKLPQRKIRVIPLGLEERFCPAGVRSVEKIKEKYNLKEKYILYVGNLRPHKNVQALLKAYAHLPEKLKQEYQLIIVGEKCHYYNVLLKLVKELKIDSRLIFTDFLEDADLPVLYSGASLFVFPSFYEGFGLPPLEAMACGTPVITSNVSSLPEVIGEAGILINPEDTYELTKAMKKLLTDAELISEMREKGLKRVKLFQVQETNQKILNLFEKILKNNLQKNR